MKRWPLKEAYFWERAPFFRLLLPLIAGIIVYDGLRIPATLVVLFAACSFIVYLIANFIRAGNISRYTHFVSKHLVVLCLGWLLCYLNDVDNSRNYFGHEVGTGKKFAARVAAMPVEKQRTWKLKVDILYAVTDSSVTPAAGTANIYTYKTDTPLVLKQGDTILLPDNWQKITTAGNPYEFDYTSYAARNNLHYQMFLPQQSVMLLGKANEAELGFIKASHNWCMFQLSKFVKDKTVLGLLQAMLIGDEANLDADLRQAYAETGIIHIIAISGSHITFFFVLIAFMLGWIKNRKYHWLKYMLALPLVWFYVLMAGAPPSAVRAALMFSLLAIGFAFQRQSNSLNQLFAAAFLLLCAEPMWLYSVGFQLSFLAVLSLIIFYKPIYNWLTPSNRIYKALWATASASIAAELLVAPLVIYYFHLFPLLFIVANVAAYLFMGIAIVCGLLIVVCSPIPVIAQLIADGSTLLIQVFNKLVYVFQKLNPTSFKYLHIHGSELLLLYGALVLILIYCFKKNVRVLVLGLSVMVLFLCSLCYNEYMALTQQRLVVYNVRGKTHIEIIEGKRHYVVQSDSSIQPKQLSYAALPSHIAWHAWCKASRPYQHIQHIGNRSVLILNKLSDNATEFPVDYLIINCTLNPPDVAGIKINFNPRKVIFSKRLRPKTRQALLNALKIAKIPVHIVAEQGAFIISAK